MNSSTNMQLAHPVLLRLGNGNCLYLRAWLWLRPDIQLLEGIQVLRISLCLFLSWVSEYQFIPCCVSQGGCHDKELEHPVVCFKNML